MNRRGVTLAHEASRLTCRELQRETPAENRLWGKDPEKTTDTRSKVVA